MKTLLSCAALLLWHPVSTAPAQEVEEPLSQIEPAYTMTAYLLNDPNSETIETATATLEHCAIQGHPLAAVLLLDVYEGKRRGLPAQPEKAAALAHDIATGKQKLRDSHRESVAAKQESMYRYALYCEKGTGRAKSLPDAYEWMLKASNSGYGKARVELARYLINGKGCKKNPRTALRLLKAQAGINATVPNLFFYMGHIYLSGAGLPKKRADLAFRYFSYGDKMNDANAINNLATMYEHGLATEKNELEALRLYKKAAQLGNKAASANMQRLGYVQAGHENGTPDGVRIDRAVMQVIEALPLPQHLRSKMAAPVRRHEKQQLESL